MTDEKFYDDDDDESDSDDESDEEGEEKKSSKKPKKKAYSMDPDHRLLLRVSKPLLQSRNAAVSFLYLCMLCVCVYF